MKRMLVVRHGQSEWNALGLWQGQADPQLSSLGEFQAKQAAEMLVALGDSAIDRSRGATDAAPRGRSDGGVVFDLIATSNLRRARTTGQIIADALGLDIGVIDPRIGERNAGEWSGLSRAEIDQRYPGYLESGKRPPGYEGDDALLPRLLEGMANVAGAVRTTALVIAHGGVIYMLEQHLGAPFARIGNLGGRWLTCDDQSPDPAGRPVFALGERINLIEEPTIPDQL